MIHELHQLLDLAARRIRKLHLWWTLAWCWSLWALAGGLAAVFAGRYDFDQRQVVAWLVAGALVSAFVCWRLSVRAARDPRRTACRIEARYPELGALLLAAVEQAPVPRFKRLGYLQSTVVRDAVEHGRRHNWADATSRGRVRFAQAAQFVALGVLVAACLAVLNRGDAVARSTASDGDDPALPAGAYEVRVEPGNAEIERGTTLLVIARFKGPVPPEATLILNDRPAPSARDKTAAGPADDKESTRAMTRSLDDPQFVGRVPMVENDFTYAVEFVGRRSPVYRVTVFDYPALVRADAHLKYLEFTRLEPKVVEDVRTVTAVEGSEVTLKFRLNKEVTDARLVERSGDEVALVRGGEPEPVYSTTFTLKSSRRFKLHLIDSEDRKNKFPPEITVNVTPNRPPAIKLTKPWRTDVRVSPLEELEVAADVTDDFGLTDFGISYSIGGGEPQETSLLVDRSPNAATKSLKLSHLIDFESLKAEPDQLASYHVWAEDLGPDGKPRRVMSDMYFAEVRPFDEIFRQGQQPTEQQMQDQANQQGAQGGAGQQAEQLAEIQKQIVSATWKLIRRELGATPTPEFGEDVGAVQESQQHAIDKLEELGGQVTDAQSRQYVEETRKHMDKALEQLTKATDAAATAPLRPAMSAEQAAYQSLLKLRAREFNVTRNNSSQQSGQGGAGQNGTSQRQLQQLELSADENRYETQSRAASAQSAEAQRRLDESRQLLDKLRELGRRQEDLNERLRELQSALQAAQNEQERREIERQLKRLRDQQREILRDTDQLQGEMDNSENREQMQESREQLDSARSRVQDASQALDEGRLSQAVTEGARAGRELNELRDQFRRQTADRFADEMRELRNAGRQLDERQQQLSEHLAQQDAQRGRALRDAGPREELTQGMQQQQQQLGETLERMRQTVSEAEEPEPLLARELYDAVGETARQQTEEALDVARRLVEAALRDAAEAMRLADRGVEELRGRLDRAAESVLGDETEALRRASDQLRELADDVNREIENGRGRRVNEENGEPSDQSERQGDSVGQQPSDREGNQAGGGQRRRDSENNRDRQGGAPGDNRSNDADREDNQPRGRGGQEVTTPGDESDRPNEQERQPGQQGREGESPSNEAEGKNQQGEQGPSPGGDNRRGGRDGRGERPNEAAGGARGSGERFGGLEDFFRDGGRAGGPGGPITGEDFRQWADRMRDVEDMLDDPELSAEVARIRDRAQEARVDYKRHARPPDWTKLQDLVAEPLNELRERIAEEIRRKESPDALAPIDRDSAPAEFADQIRLYYQRLGSGE